MKTIFAILLLASSSQAALLSTLSLTATSPSVPATTTIRFSVYNPGSGLGEHWSTADLSHSIILPENDIMYIMARNPELYSAHGWPLVQLDVNSSGMSIGAQDVSASFDDYYGLSIHGTPEARTIPWRGLSLERTQWSLDGSAYSTTFTAKIYDIEIPEPSVFYLLSMLVFARSCCRLSRSVR